MESNGCLWFFIGPFPTLWVFMGSYNFFASLLVLMGSYKSLECLWVFMSFYRSYCVPMVSNGSLCILIGPYAFLWLGSYSSLCVLMISNEYLWVLIDLYASFTILMGSCSSL